MRSSVIPPPLKSPDFKQRLKVTVGGRKAGSVEIPPAIVPNVEAEIYLPERSDGELEVRLYARREQAPGLFAGFRYSFESEADQGGVVVRSNRAYWKGGGEEHWSSGVVDGVVICEPRDLEILQPPGHVDHTKISGCFWITPNFALKPFKTLLQSYTGEVTIKGNEPRTFDVDGHLLKFEHWYKYQRSSGNDTLVFFEPVAEFEVETEADINALLLDLDDVLLLASFGTRQRTICHGWTAETPRGFVRQYRRKYGFPQPKPDHTFNHFLVFDEMFDRFMAITWAQFRQHSQKDLVRQALWRITSDVEQTGETIFLVLFSAVENMLEVFSRESPIGKSIVDRPTWKALKADLDRVIGGAVLGRSQYEQLFQKVRELNRKTLATAFDEFAIFKRLRLEGLWPFVGDGHGITLTAIRNRLIHGYQVSPDDHRSLLIARLHLQWTAEQMMLRILGWPVEESVVSPQVIENRFPDVDWQRERETLTAAWSNRSNLVG